MTYHYVGPADVAAEARTQAAGTVIASPGDFADWAQDADLAEPCTFVVDLDGRLRLAPRRSEHVACAGGAAVLSAGEIGFERAGFGHPGGFTYPITFRRCPECQEINVVKDGYFGCAFCAAELPEEWNVGLTDGR